MISVELIVAFVALVMLGFGYIAYACCYMSGVVEDAVRDKELFELWVGACEEFDERIYKLTSNPEDGHGVYETVKEYYPSGQFNTMRDCTYHLWWHYKHETVSRNATELLRVFEGRQEKEKK